MYVVLVSVSTSGSQPQLLPSYFQTSPATHPVVDSAIVVPFTSIGLAPEYDADPLASGSQAQLLPSYFQTSPATHPVVDSSTVVPFTATPPAPV